MVKLLKSNIKIASVKPFSFLNCCSAMRIMFLAKSSFLLLHYLSILFCVAPLFTGKAHSQFKYYAIVNKLYSLLFFATVFYILVDRIVFSFILIDFMRAFGLTRMLITSILITFIFFTKFIAAFGSMVFSFWKSSSIHHIADRLDKIAWNLGNNYSGHRKYPMFLVFQVFVFLLAVTIFSVIENVVMPGVDFIFRLGVLSVNLINFQSAICHLNIVKIVSEIKFHFHTINTKLSEPHSKMKPKCIVFLTYPARISDSAPTTDHNNILVSKYSLFRTIHDELCEVIITFNECYGFLLLCHMVENFCYVVCGLNYIVFMYQQGFPNSNALLSTICGWLTLSFCKLTTLSSVCSAAFDEADRTGILVHRLLRRDLHPDIKEELQLFASQLLHKKAEFTACGLFPINLSLLHSVVAAVTTYLVILIQFQSSSKPDPPFPIPPRPPGEDNFTEPTPMLFTPT